ncbi:MAG: putative integral rane protein, partial [Acidimicrobiia bacterium]|nr:putative integral rane protein [Acidimicrobiia bacterium]
MNTASPSGTSGRATRHAAPEAEAAARGKWADGAARLGLAGRGVIWVLIGVIAARLASGNNPNAEADRQGALRQLADQRFGEVVLVALAIGLAGYVLWRLSEAIWGYQHETDKKKRLGHRVSSVVKAIAYLAFLASVISVLRGSSSSKKSGNQQPKVWTARVLGWPAGQTLVTIAGLVVIAGGCYLIYRGVTRKFEKKLEMGRMSESVRKATRVLGTFGVAARGAVFAAAGLLLVKAARDFDPNQTQGIDGTLRTVAAQT